jgi:hypothetical protein
MFKSVVLASAICFAFVVPAAAQEQQFTCDEANLTKMRGDIDAMTDKEKQKASLENWEAANTAFKANDQEKCRDLFSSLNNANQNAQDQTSGGNNNNNTNPN